MLVLSRKLNEEITIGNDVVIKVVAVHGNKVRLGISAPAHVSIRRSELEFEVPSESARGGDRTPFDAAVPFVFDDCLLEHR